jgi:hypothetical protein
MQLNKKFAFRFLGFVALVLLCWFALPIVSMLLIAGVIQQGILGGFSGKVGPVVGGSWKGIDYMRSYVIPANPQSTDQVTQRTRFTTIQDYARQVLSTLIQPYWDQYQTGQSGYNAIMSNWMLNADSSDLLVSACSMAKGTLAVQAVDTGTYDVGTVNLEWTESLVGNQLTTDVAHAVVFNKDTGNLYYSDGTLPKTRADEVITFNIPSGITPADCEAYLFFSQGTGSSMIVSDSVHITLSIS